MAQQIINVGAAANDGQGDPIRTAFIKCNQNFTQLFSIYTTVPTSLTGSSADIAGMYANDANYFYYCFADWTSPGTAIIWAKISEVDTTSYISNGNTSVAIPTTNGNILFDVGNVANVVVMTTAGLEVNGNTSVTGFSAIGTNLLVGQNTNVGGNVNVIGNLTVVQKSTFSDNVTVNANLVVNGNITYINVDELKVTDPLIQLAANNATTDVMDVGFYGEWNDGVFQYGGLARDASDGDWKLFSNVTTQPTTVVDFTNAVYDNLVMGDLTSTNIFNSGNVSVTGNILGGNIGSLGNVDVVGNINANNATITNNTVIGGNATVIGNIIGGNIASLGNVDVVGNINANNATITTNVVVGGNVDVVGNINANNATITNNVVVGGNVTAAGLVTDGLYWGNGNPIISNTGNLTLNSITTTGNANIGGNIVADSLSLSGNAAITGNISADSLDLSGNATVIGNILGGNIASLGNIDAIGNITGANLISQGNVDVTGDIHANNAAFGNDVVVGGTMFVGNIIPSANVTYTLGNSTRQWKDLWVSNSTIFINSIPLTMSNASVLLWNTVPLISSVTDQDLNSTGNIAAANITGAGFFFANGSPVVTSSGNVASNNIVATGNATIGGNISGGNLAISGVASIVGNVSGGNLNTAGNVVAGNLIVPVAELGNIRIVGNVISTTTTDPDMYIDPFNGGGTVGTVYVLGNLQVTGNLTTVNSNTVTVDSLLFQAANNAPNQAAADGGGLAVGPAGSSYATWTYGVTANSWVSNLPISVKGANVNGAITNATTITANGAITTSAAVTGSTLVSTVAAGTAPLTVTSNTVVTNLNANFLNGLTNTSANTISTVVSRDTNADFAGNTITAREFVGGNVTTANITVTNIANLSSANVEVYSLGVGTAASGVDGEIRAANNVTGYYSSDSRFKENIIDISEPAHKVRAIGGKLFDWTDEYINSRGGEDDYFLRKHDFGVIAQDVQSVFPEAVRTRADGSLAVDYPKLSALAFAAINELSEKFSKEIAELRSEIEQLKGK